MENNVGVSLNLQPIDIWFTAIQDEDVVQVADDQ